ncbi:hypothetical protein GCM10009424_27760 [Sphingomonas ursincola]|uniref:Autotransporter domain-containing protein n=1 Tax=Sphingomonas ursincola TaxID=56361 RepID=A0A7V8RBP6_9SPHN|nr:autotransporter-associated beta strand repeat-containing protein [Sphingomonas ursincola]MBA1373486.1 hypothetical protein [Sphingomonas ursincola]
MQSIRNRGADRAERRERAVPQRLGLFSTTALIPAIAALAGGALTLAPGQAQAQTVAASGVVTNGFGENSLCLDAALDLCQIDLGEVNDAPPPVLADLATGSAGRSLLIGGGDNGSQFFTVTSDGYEFNNDFNTQNPLVLSFPVTIVRAIGSSSFHQQSISETGGSRVLRKTGSETLFLLGFDNTYSGGTIVSEGFLGWDRDRAFGIAGTGVTIDNGAGVNWTGSFATTRAFTLTGGSATIRAQSGVTGTVNGTISGPGGLTVGGPGLVAPGTIVLGSNNTYQGGTSIVGGTLIVTNNNSLGTLASGTTVSAGATLAVQGGLTGLNEGIALSGTGMGGAGALRNLSGNNVLTGGVTVAGAALITSDAGLLDLAGPLQSSGAFGLTFGGAGSVSLRGQIVGSISGLTKTGTGTLILGSGFNPSAYNAGLDLAQGTVSVRTNLGAGFGTIRTTGSVIDYAQDVNMAAPIELNSNTTQLQVTTGTATQSGIISEINGARPIEKIGAGTLILTNTNTYAGGTIINGGALQIGNGGTTGTLGSGTVTINGAQLIFNRSDDITVANDITSSGTLIKRGGGTVTLTGAKGYSNTFVEAGTLALRGTSPLSGGGVLQLTGGTLDMGVDGVLSNATHSGGTLALNGRTLILTTGNYNASGGSLTGGGTIQFAGNSRGLLITGATSIDAGTTILSSGFNNRLEIGSLGADYTLAAAITGSGAANNLGSMSVILGNTGFRTTLSGNSSYAAGTSLNSGTLVVASDTALGTGALTMAANTVLESGGTGNRTLANAITLNGAGISIANPSTTNTFTLGGVIGGSNGFAKTGAGTLILTGNNSLSGNIALNAGTLQLGSGALAGSLGSTGVVMANGTSLVFDSSASQNVSNVLSGTGSLTKRGSGTLTLSGSNSFSGAVSLDGGALQLTGGSSIGDTAALSMATSTLLGVGSSETIGSLAGNGTVVLQASSVLTTGGNNNSTTFAGSLTGLGGLTKTGSGTLTLTGTSNFVGTTTISGGTLQIGNATTTGTIIGGPIVNNASLVFNRSDNIDSSVAISGTGSLTKQGLGTLTLLSTNSYAGGTTISAGILQLGSGSTTGSLGTGGVTISTNGTLRSNSSVTQTIAGALAGSGALVQQGTGTTILGAAANGYSGTAQIFAGTLQLGNLTALGTGAVELRGGSLHLANAGVYTNNINAFTADGNVLSTVAGSQVTLTGQFGGAGTLRLAPGTGSTLDIAAATGTAGASTRIIVQSGTVRSQSGILGQILGLDATQTQVDAGATLNFNTRLSTISNLSGAGTILNDGSTTTLRNGTFSGAFGGTQSLATTGNISLSGSSSYTGTTTVQSGTLTIGSNTALGNSTGGTTVASGATLQFSGTPLTIGDALTISGSGNGGIGAIRVAPLGASGNEATSITGGVTLAADSTITVADRILLSFNTGGIALGSSTLTFASEGTGNSSIFVNSAISGTGALVKTGSGLLRLNGNNGFTGPLTINGGDVVLASGTALADTVAVSLATGARLFVSSTETIGSLAGAGTVSFENASVLTTGGNNASTTFAGSVNGTGNLTKSGTGTFTLSGTSGFAGITTISGGTLQIGDGGTTGAIGSGQIITNANLAFNRSDALAIANAISGFGTLTKLGAGTLTLSGANSYSGDTTISAGTLVLDQVAGGTIGAAGTGTITLENNSALLSNVTGTLANRISIASSATASIGAASGTTLTLTGDQFETSSPVTLTFGSSTATGLIELAAPSGVSVAAGTASTIAGGTVRTGNAFAASVFSLASGGTTIGTGTTAATLDVNGLNFQLVNLTGSASGTLTNLGSQAATTTLNTQIFSAFDGVITNGASALNLVKTGSGTLALTGTNTYSGTTTVTAGTLNVGRAGTSGTLGSGAVIVGAAGRLLLNRTNDLLVTNAISGAGEVIKGSAGTTTLTGDNSGYTGTLSVTNGTLQIGNGGTSGSLGTGAVANDATLAINLASDITLAQAITGNGALRKLGSGVTTIGGNVTQGSATVEAGTLALSGSNSFTNGITVAGGTLSLRSNNAAGGATGVIRTTGSVVDYADGIDMATPIELNSNTTQLQVLAGSATQSGVISEIGGARPLEKIGAGTLTLSATNSYSGGTTISAGRLNITSNANLGAIAGGVTIGNAVLGTTGLISSARAVSLTGAAGIDVSSSSLTLTGAVTGAGSLTKTGTGQLVLTADNSYAGTTTISGSGGLTVGTGGNTGTLGSGNITVNAGSFLAFSRSDAFTVANAISGQGNVGKQSSGTLTLSGANTFSGGLAIGAGTVVLASANAGVITAAGTGNITFSSNTTLRTDVSGTLGNNLFFGSGSSTVAAATGTTLRLASNVLSFEAGAGSPLDFGTASATGTIELAPVTVSVGAQVNPIAINGGTLRLANAGAYTLLNGANGVFLNGATLGADVAGTLTKVLTIGATGGTIDVAAASLTLQGANSHIGVLTKTGTGELRLTGAGTGSGTVQLNAGSLALLATNAGWGTGTLQMATGTTLRLGLPSPATLANNIVLGAGAGSTIIASSTTFSGALSGGDLTIAAGLGADGPSVVRLTGTNSYGATTISAGNTLQIGTTGTGGTLGTGNVTVNAGATLRFSGNDLTVANVVSGAGQLVRDGLGTTTLTGANSYAGGTVISGGGIVIGNTSALGTGGVTMSGSSSLDTAAGVSASINGLSVVNFGSSPIITASAGQTLSLGGTFSVGPFVSALSFGSSTGTGTIALDFAAVPTVSSDIQIRVNGGTLKLGSTSEALLLNAAGGLAIGALGTIDLNGFAGGGVSIFGSGTISNSSTTAAQFTALQNAATTFSGIVGGGTGAISLVKSGTGALTLAGANSYTGITSITGGSLQIGDGGTTGSLGTGNVAIASGAQLLLNRSDALSLANVFTGAGTVQKNLASTLTLTGSNTAADGFTGTFNINAGTLLVNGVLGDLTNRAATINVASGATLSGSGTIQGNVVVANGGILSPGTSPATQTIAGNLTLNDSSVLNFELAQPGVVGGGINDLITVGGNLVLDGTLNVTALDGFSAGFYRLFNYGGTLTNNGLNMGTLPLGFISELRADIAGQINILFNAGGQTVQYWDGADLTGAVATVNGDGGAGTWTSTSTNWTNPTGFAVNTPWAGQAGVFAGAAGGAVGIIGSQAFQELRFLTDGYVLNAADSTGGLATTGGFSIVNVNSGLATRINAPISGTAGLTKSGGGTLTLGGANSYAGLTTVSGGTLSLVSGGTIAGAVQNNATLTNAGTIIGLVTNAGTLTSTGTLAGGLTNNAGATASISGTLDGPVSNAATITLTGATTGAAAVTQTTTGSLNLAGFNGTIGSLAGAGAVQLGNGTLTTGGNNSTTTFAGVISGSGGLTKIGSGTLSLTGANAYAGQTSINGGTLELGFGGSLTGAVVNNGTFNNAGVVNGLVTNGDFGILTSLGALNGGLVNNGRFTPISISGQLNGNVSNSGVINFINQTVGNAAITQAANSNLFLVSQTNVNIGSLAGAGSVVLSQGSTLTIGSNNASTSFSGVVSGTGTLAKTGTGTLTLSGANNLTGLTTVSQGSLSIAMTGSLAGAVQNNATLANAGSIAGLVTNAGTLTSTGTLGGGLSNNAGATAAIRGTLNGPVSNAGTITLTGTTTGNAALAQTGNGTFNLAGFDATIGSLSGTLVGSGSVQLGSGTLTLGGNNSSTSFNGVISGTGQVIKTGTGSFAVTAANTYTGLTTVNGGTFTIGFGGSLAGSVQNNATLVNLSRVSGQVTNAGILNSTGSIRGGLVNNAGATANLAGLLNGAVSNSGNITLVESLTSTGSFTQSSGASLNLAGFEAGMGSIAGNGAIQLGSGTLTAGASNASTSFDGIISGSGTFNKAGTGTLTLGGSNTAAANFTGTVNVNAGSLVLNGQFGDVAANSANLSLANGATLAGSGSFLGNISLGAGAILAPGNSPATIAIGGNLLLDSASILNFELAQAGVVGGGINDLITVSGNLTLDGTLNVAALTGFGEGIYRLINYGGTLTDNGLLVGTRPDGFTASVITNIGGQISVQFTLGIPTVLYWDGTDTTAASSAITGNGGSGTWNSTSTNWTSAPGFSTAFGWNSQTGVFAGAAGGTVQVSGTQAFQQLRFETGGYVLNTAPGGGALATTGGTSVIDVSAGLGATINAPIQGTAGITKAGAGTLTLGGFNSYAGLTSIAAGTLALSSGGTIVGAVDNGASFASAGNVRGQVTNRASLTSTGRLDGGLVNAATGIANLSGVWNGAISNAGTVRLSGLTSGNVAFNQQGSGLFDLAGSFASIGSLAGSGSVQLGSGLLQLGRSNASTSFAGVISGSGGLEKEGTGTFTLTGANSFTGRTLVSGGTLVLASGASLAGSVTNNAVFTNAGTVANGVINNGALVSTGSLNGSLVNNAGATASLSGAFSGNLINRGTVNLTGTTIGIGELSLATGAVFNLGGFATTIGNLTGGGGTVALGSGTLTLGSGTGSQTFDGMITGSGGLTKVSASTFSLSGAQGYTGLTTVNGGTLILGSNASLAGGVLNNARFTNAGRVSGLVTNIATLESTGALNAGLVNATGASARIRGILAGSVTNAGTITLTGAISGIGAVTQEATGTFDLGGFGTSIGSLAGSGAVILGAAPLTTGGDNGSSTFAGTVSGDGGIVKTGTGTFVLSGANSYAGLTTVSQGVLSVRNNAGLGGNAAGTVVDAGAALELQGGITLTGEALTINGTGVNGAGALRNVADNNIWAGTVTLGSDSLITADAGRLDIDLLAGSTQALTTGGAGLIGLANANTAGALTVTGGNLALFGTGNFASGVNVNAGNLFLQGGSSVNDAAAVTLGTGNVIVAVSETIGSLAGTGGTVQIDAGQTLTLGGSDASTSFGGVIFNTGNLAKQGSGTFTVTGTLAHSGTTTITGGTLLSGAANIWQGNGLVTIGNGGTLDLGGFDQSIAAISLAGGTLANGALTGSISTSGGTIRDITGAANSLRAIGGTTTLTGAGSFAQGVTLAGGDVVLQGAGASIADTALVAVNTGTLLVNVGETIGALAGSGGRVQIAQGQALVTGGSNASTAYAGVLAGNGAVIKTGTGTFTLSGANTLTGTVTVNAGVLALASGGSLAGAVQNAAGFSNAGTVAGLVTNTGTLISTGVLNGGLVNSGSAGLSGQLGGAVTNSSLVQLQGALTGITGFSQSGTGAFDLAGFSTSIGSLSGAGNVLLGSATLTLGGSNASTSFSGTIGGTGGLIKTGTGSFTLTTGQVYTGLTTVNGGLLTVAAGAGLSGSVLNNASFASSGLILGSLTNNGTATLSGQVNGTVANNAVIALDGQLVVLGRLTQNAGGSLNLAGFNAGLGSLAGTGPIALGSGTLVVGSDNSSSLFSGVISGSGGLQKIGTGTFTLTGINSYTGLTLVNAGTLVIGEGVSVGGTTSGIAATVAAPSVLAAPVANAASGPIAAEQTSMPAAVTSLAVEQTSMPATVTSLAAETASTVSASLASRAGMMVDNISISGGPTPASLAPSAERLPLAGGVSSGPERVDLFGDSTSGAVSANLPVVTLGEASQTVAPAAASTASAAGRIGLVSDLSNSMGTARLDGALMGGAEMASPVAAALVDANAPAASAGETAFAGPLTPAVIAGSVLNNANLINNGSILGQLVNSAGATAVNNGVIRGLVINAGTFTSTGTLSGGLSNSGTARISGTLTGDVLNSGSITLTGITSGIAVFQQAATGSLNLAGFDTTLGVLSGAGTITLGSARLTTGTNGVNSLFSGVISGTGALTKTGTGGLILDGENSYSGGTTIAGGVLQLGNGGATGSIIGPVLNNGTLIINRSNAYTFAGVISGTGMFVQAGSGTTTLTGANSYTGGTLISAGRLIGSTVSLQGLIQNDAALEFAQGTTGVFAGRIGGTGLLDKSGVGLLELTGDNSALRGATTVRAGELRVTGSLAGSATTVLSGATLSGNGTVGGLIARSGSVVSPGAGGLGMLGLNGAIQLQSGSTLRLQVQAPSGSDMLIGNGTMQLGGTAAITNLGGTYAFNSNYLLLQASGGRTGTFDAVTGFGEFGILYRPELVYTANQVLLRMAPNLLTNILGNTPLTANQRSVVSRIDAAVTAGYNPQPLFNVYALPNAQQPNAFDQLSGEVYATMAGVGIEQERLVREAVLGRINAVAATARQTPEWGNGAGAWGQVFGSWGAGERDGNAARYESDRQGFITGIDYGNANSEGSWRIGAFGVHMTSKVSVDARGSRAEVEQTGGGLYAGVNTGGVSVGMGASVTGVDLTAVRNIALPGFAETNRGRGDGRAVQGFAELSYAIEAGNATYRPFASVAVGEFKLDALTETGGAAALSVRRQSYRSGSVTVGADGTVRMGRVNLSGTLAGRFQVGDRDPAAQIALAAAPAQAFTIRGVQLDSFALAARLDATVKLTDGADLSLGYTGLIGKDTADHGARATLSVRF